MAGYLGIAAGGFFVATGVTGLLVVWLGDANDPPLGAIIMFLGANATWATLYDRLYRRLRRPEPTSRLARTVRAMGRTSGKVGPGLFATGVALTAVL